MAEVHRIFPYLVTCGPEFDEMELPGTDMLEGFWLDEMKELALGAALKAVRTDLRTTHKTTALHSMNPGSGNIDVWPIEEQRPLFRLIGEDAQRWSGVTLTDSLLMVPNKSISGFFLPELPIMRAAPTVTGMTARTAGPPASALKPKGPYTRRPDCVERSVSE